MMEKLTTTTLLCLFFLCTLRDVDGLYIKGGSLKSASSWAYLTRFCFLPKDVTLQEKPSNWDDPYVPEWLKKSAGVTEEKTDSSECDGDADPSCNGNEDGNEGGQNDEPKTVIHSNGFHYKITYNASHKLRLVVYYRSEKNWNRVWGDSDSTGSLSKAISCQEKMDVARESNNIFNLYALSDWESSGSEKKGMRTVVGSLKFNAKRERWYYFVLANCEDQCDDPHGICQGSIDVDNYEIAMTNGYGPERHFSADQQGILTAAIIFSILYSIISMWAALTTKALIRRRKFHHVCKILVVSICLHYISLFCDVGGYGQFGVTGDWNPRAIHVALFLRCFSETLFILAILLVAKGWTIVRRKISAGGRVKISSFITLYLCVAIMGVAWYVYYDQDEAKIVSRYLSPPGTLQVLLRVGAFLWFSYAQCTTTKLDTFRRRQKFYTLFYLFFGPWLLTFPFEVWISTLLGDHVKAKFVYYMDMSFALLGHVILLVLWWPSRFNKMFPFAFKTAAMEENAAMEWKSSEPSRNGTAAVRRGSRSTGASIAEGMTGNVQMTKFGPSGNSPDSATGFTTRKSISGTPHRMSVTGGAQIRHPLNRVRTIARQLRQRLAVVYEYADNLETTLDEFQDPDMDRDVDFDESQRDEI
eukprot:g4709.t1